MRAFDIIDAPQRSPEWYAARSGRLTGSVAGDMLAKIKSGEAAARRNLRLKLVLERVTGKTQEREFQTQAMIDGIEREEFAFRAYEAYTGDVAQRSGFLAHRTLMAGCSLDGHLGDFTRLLSIKCRQPPAHLEFVVNGRIPADALAQMRHELWMTGAESHDYFSWNPDFPEKLQSRMVTITRAEADIPGYAAAAIAFLEDVDRECQAVATMADLQGQLKASVA